MRYNYRRSVGWLVGLILLSSGSVRAQSLQLRLDRVRTRSVWTSPAAVAQANMVRQRLLAALASGAVEGAPSSNTPASVDSATGDARTVRPRREPIVFVDGRFAFDKQNIIIAAPGPVAAQQRRHVYIVATAVDYPLTDRTHLSLSVPYVYQRATLDSPAANLTQTGSGLGDVTVFVEQRFPEAAKGTEVAVAAGLAFPTGKDPFNLGPTQLPTGNGFYQPLLRVSVRKLRVPLQLYGALEYGTSFSRNINGQRRRLPASYGGEVGFFYALGPEFTAQTGLSMAKQSSPFINDPSATIGYLTQALIYNTGKLSSLRGSVDVGLTQESLDASFGLSWNRRY